MMPENRTFLLELAIAFLLACLIAWMEDHMTNNKPNDNVYETNRQ